MRKRIIGLGLIGLVAIGAIVFFGIFHSRSSEESRPAAAASQSAVEAVGSAASGVEPSRASVADIREMDLLWRDLDALRQQAHELSPFKYKVRYVGRTATFLQLADADTVRFATNVHFALQDFREARKRVEKAQAQVAYNPNKGESVTHYRATWNQYSKDRQAAVGRIPSTLAPTPRAQLLKDQWLKWVMRLEQGCEEASKPARRENPLKPRTSSF